MEMKRGHLHPYEPNFLPLSLEADRLSMQLEQALSDPSASEETFFQALDQYSSVLQSLEQQRDSSSDPFLRF